ncbi:IclR family transcriptional regulator [Verticiella sediminum]|uniref:IclR family transcriptional regulator n=1 Tax=Verticiella sediminum TaxID=1247510 RepID=A0A556AYW9_9BURK|nr:IclR family transcriptional regulator [Verticiella sediminum]TSH98131.1 IclR family transcriptional regulator [Verticiella sediminum]
MATTTEKSENVRAVGRALEILLAFTPQDVELSPAELLKRVDLSRPTLYRLLYTLEEHGFLVSAGEPQKFRLGPSVARLAHVWTSSLDLSLLAQPVLQRIWRETSETVAMFVPQGPLRLCVAELPSPQPLNFKRGVGYTERIVRGASGRAILAYMDAAPEELREYLRDSGVDLKVLQEELVQTRKRGYASSHNELISGAVAVAVPFFDRHGAAAGSIGVFGPEVRLNASRLKQVAKLLVEEAATLSGMLGHSAEHSAEARM